MSTTTAPNEVRAYEIVCMPDRVIEPPKNGAKDTYPAALADVIAAAADRYGQRMPSIILVHNTLLERAREAMATLGLLLEVKTTGGMFINEVWIGRPPGDPGETLTLTEGV